MPPVTEDDRRAAFPDLDEHSVHDTSIHYFVLFDQLEWQKGRGRNGLNLDGKGWIGGDLHRFWFRGEGETDSGRVTESQAHLLYGRAIGRWWDFVAGIRQDFNPSPAQSWAAIGLQGLAPYWFEIEATAYVGQAGRTHVRLEAEYEVLITNRLVAQPLLELELYGKSIPDLGIGAGLSSTDLGIRVRYEIRREIAPYVGVTWNRKYGGTASAARAQSDRASDVRLTVGLRKWF